ncbi:energy transducer TonB [Altererythrobacter sp. FM1]|nr:energy transducer TonB [Altererythrobacter sp. FM1]
MPTKAEPTVDPSSWVMASDFPPINQAISNITYELTVNRQGKPDRCTIVFSSRSTELDAAVCGGAMKRARFRPAKDRNGAPAFFVRRERINFVADKTQAGEYKNEDADIVISLPDVPQNNSYMTEVLLTMAGDGTLSDCAIRQSNAAPALDKLACEVASSPQIAAPIRDGNGNTVPGIRNYYVGYSNAPTVGAISR